MALLNQANLIYPSVYPDLLRPDTRASNNSPISLDSRESSPSISYGGTGSNSPQSCPLYKFSSPEPSVAEINEAIRRLSYYEPQNTYNDADESRVDNNIPVTTSMSLCNSTSPTLNLSSLYKPGATLASYETIERADTSDEIPKTNSVPSYGNSTTSQIQTERLSDDNADYKSFEYPLYDPRLFFESLITNASSNIFNDDNDCIPTGLNLNTGQPETTVAPSFDNTSENEGSAKRATLPSSVPECDDKYFDSIWECNVPDPHELYDSSFLDRSIDLFQLGEESPPKAEPFSPMLSCPKDFLFNKEQLYDNLKIEPNWQEEMSNYSDTDNIGHANPAIDNIGHANPATDNIGHANPATDNIGHVNPATDNIGHANAATLCNENTIKYNETSPEPEVKVKPKRQYKRRVPKELQQTKRRSQRKSTVDSPPKKVKLEEGDVLTKEEQSALDYASSNFGIFYEHCYIPTGQIMAIVDATQASGNNDDWNEDSCDGTYDNSSSLSDYMDSSVDDEAAPTRAVAKRTTSRSRKDAEKKLEHNRTEKARRSELSKHFDGLKEILDEEFYQQANGNGSKKSASKRVTVIAAQLCLNQLLDETTFMMQQKGLGDPMSVLINPFEQQNGQDNLLINRCQFFDLSRGKKKSKQ